MSITARDLVVGAIALVVGIAAAGKAAMIENTTGTPVGPGAFPLVLGICIALAGVFIIVPALRTAPRPSRPEPGSGDSVVEGSARSSDSRLASLVLPTAVIAFCVVAVTLSLTVATAATFALCGRYMARYRWTTSAAIGIVAALTLHIVFRVLLVVSLPVDRVL